MGEKVESRSHLKYGQKKYEDVFLFGHGWENHDHTEESNIMAPFLHGKISLVRQNTTEVTDISFGLQYKPQTNLKS